jgi:putative restriction endonuclease
MMTLPDTQPLLIGVWHGDAPAVLVAAQPEQRLGDLTRFSVLFPERLFRQAQEFGWAEPYRNNNGDLHWAFFPQLLPTFIEQYENGIRLSPKEVQIAVAGAGLVDQPEEVTAAARARAAATRLIRDAKFGKEVVAAYEHRCAMCGLNLGLIAGAHIFPVSAPGSNDHPTNGLALCENHHRAFDSHRIWVHPTSRQLKIHPHMMKSAERDKRDAVFISTMVAQLNEPKEKRHLPETRMFEERYSYFEGFYDWVR